VQNSDLHTRRWKPDVGQGRGRNLKPRLSAAAFEALRQETELELSLLVQLQAARNRGNVAFQMRRFADAVAIYSGAMDLCPTHREYMSVLYSNRAAAQMSMGRPQKAWEDCTNSLRFKPQDNLKALLRRARAAQALSRFADAVRDLEVSQRLLSESAEGKHGQELKDISRELEYCKAQAARQEEEAGKERVRGEAEYLKASRASSAGPKSAWWHWQQGKFEKVGGDGNGFEEPPNTWARQRSSSKQQYRRPGGAGMPRFGTGRMPGEASNTPDYYSILGVDPRATETEIKKAFHKLALQYHPDKTTEPDLAVAEEKFKSVNTAYMVLSDSVERRRYDLSFPS